MLRVAHGHFEVLPGVDRKLRVGIFAQDRMEAWVRFSSDTSPTDPDLGSTLGVGIKLFGVPGANGLGEPGTTADLILQNFPRFFVQDAKAMCEFTYAGVVLKDYPGYLKQHPDTQAVLDAMTAPWGSVLTSTYWAILPFKLGKEVVKYRLEPETAPQDVPDDAPDYLATDMAHRLSRDGYRFRFMIQRRTHPSTMPLDRAMDDWSEKQSPFVQIATLVLPRQDIGERGQADYGQGLSFNIWRTPPENAPCDASSIAVVRKAVYAAGAAARHRANGQPLKGAPEPRPGPPRPGVRPEPRDDSIVKAVIRAPAGRPTGAGLALRRGPPRGGGLAHGGRIAEPRGALPHPGCAALRHAVRGHGHTRRHHRPRFGPGVPRGRRLACGRGRGAEL
ncbi:hypothetical protein OV207_04885 [Corallococcus sp. BB11-1]|uniref:hypothetical protein n=1 Tax=Corallococcus sp. BB11-1 TaxID=2996783 RepID=UPI0022706C59|nr:hypothetical protein [Corallococcus sp. BB11-1]MCY1030782.1 hypothetical protein [Corallococcus sp. BB11-1]